jgi:precorrin-2 dehydrogenase/sirohydrochlorin ferrochelatase
MNASQASKKKTFYPIHLDIRNRRCLVVGGGGVGTRKVKTLLDCGAYVTVVSPDVQPALQELSGNPALTIKQRKYRSEDIDGVFLVIGATDDAALNRRIGREAAQKDILCNIVDRPESSNFILPAIVRRGDLILTVSTSGQSPAMAKNLRRELERQFGNEYMVMLKLMGAIRKKLLNQAHAPEAHKHLFEQLLNNGLLEMIQDNRTEAINRLLQRILGDEFNYEQLMAG